MWLGLIIGAIILLLAWGWENEVDELTPPGSPRTRHGCIIWMLLFIAILLILLTFLSAGR